MFFLCDVLDAHLLGVAMVLQVLTLMPLRTVMNYQYRYGTTTTQAIKTLYADGGWTRYYQGLIAALVQGPVSRFGDTAANVGILALLQSNGFLKRLPALAKTIFASLAAACFRMILTPVDTVKTIMQTEGKAGLPILRARVSGGLSSLRADIELLLGQDLRYRYPLVRSCCNRSGYLRRTLPGELNPGLYKVIWLICANLSGSQHTTT